MDKILELMREIELAEAYQVTAQLLTGVSVHDVHDELFDEMAAKDKFDEMMSGAVQSLQASADAHDRAIADRIDGLLQRKNSGEPIVRYVSIVLDNCSTYEFWQLEEGWVGWQGRDYERMDDDKFVDDMLKDLES